MVEIEGLDLIERFTTPPNMRKVIITAYASLKNALRALSLGANALTMKCISPKDLLEVVEKELKSRREELKELQEKMAEYIRNETEKNEKMSKSKVE